MNEANDNKDCSVERRSYDWMMEKRLNKPYALEMFKHTAQLTTYSYSLLIVLVLARVNNFQKRMVVDWKDAKMVSLLAK